MIVKLKKIAVWLFSLCPLYIYTVFARALYVLCPTILVDICAIEAQSLILVCICGIGIDLYITS